MKIKMILMMVCVLALTSAVFAQTNGNFATGTDPGSLGYTTVYANDSATITGWTVTAGSVDYIGGYWQAADGDGRSIDMSGLYTVGAIGQTFATTPGYTYTVKFSMSGNPDGVCGVKDMTVSAGSATPQTYTYDTCAAANTAGDMKWVTKTYTFKATSSITTLNFATSIATAFGPALDNVVVNNSLKIFDAVLLAQGNPANPPYDITSAYSYAQTYLSCPVGAKGTLTGPNSGGLIVDNFLTVNGANVCPNGSCFSSNTGGSVGDTAESAFTKVDPISISNLLTAGGIFKIDLMDFGGLLGNTEIYLADSSCTVVYPVCHKDSGKKAQKTIYVDSLNAVNAHTTQHGDIAGVCTQ